MAEQTKIQWCDHSASPWHGCSKVHEGCDHCYAEAQSVRNPSTLGVWGDDGTRIKSKSFISNLRKWNKLGESLGRVQSVFPSICDPFEDRPELKPWRHEMFEEIDGLPWVRLLLLTKRPENIRRMWPQYGPPKSEDISRLGKPLHRENVWLGASVSNQPTADKQIPELLKCRDLSPIIFVSAEPLLGPINLAQAGLEIRMPTLDGPDEVNLDWIIVGGESGHGARSCDIAWIRSIRDQCKAAGVACFVKQLGAYPIVKSGDKDDHGWSRELIPLMVTADESSAHPDIPVAYAAKLNDRKGGKTEEWPEDLRVREFPITK